MNTNNRYSYLALGDSYTIGEGVDEGERWPNILQNQLIKENINVSSPHIIAKTGWRTDELLAAINKENIQPNSYDFVSLLIGVNNQYQKLPIQKYEEEFEELLQKAMSISTDKHRVLVVSIPDYGATPFGTNNANSITKEINAYNHINHKMTSKTGAMYINITPISRKGLHDRTWLVQDELHPSGKMYKAWVSHILQMRIQNLF